MSSGQRDGEEKNWAGKSVSIECKEQLGVYQGIISRCTPSEITIIRAFRNGVPLKVDDAVTLRSTDIIKISMLPSSFNNRNNAPSSKPRSSVGKPSNTVANNLANTCQPSNVAKKQQQQQQQHFAYEHQQQLQHHMQQLQQHHQKYQQFEQYPKHTDEASASHLNRQLFNTSLNNETTSGSKDTSNAGFLTAQKAIHVDKSPPSNSVVNFFSNLIPSKVENKLGANLCMVKIAPKATFAGKNTSMPTTTAKALNAPTKTNIIHSMAKTNNVNKNDNVIIHNNNNNSNYKQYNNPFNNINTNNTNNNNKSGSARDSNSKQIDDLGNAIVDKYDKQYQQQQQQQQNGIITITNASLLNNYGLYRPENNRNLAINGNLISNSHSNGNENGDENGNENGSRQKARGGKQQQMRRECFGKHSQTFGTSVEDPQMLEDFDFEGNLALFDKKAIWNSLESGKEPSSSLGQNTLLIQRKERKDKYRHDENVLESEPVELRQIESFFGSNQDFVTDEGLIIPTIPIYVRNKIEKCAEKNGFSLQRQIDLLARGTTDLAMLLLGGARRLTPNNHHQWPIVVIICEKSDNFRDSNVGAATGRQIASHGLKVVLYLEENKNIEQKSIEISLFKATDNSVFYFVDQLPTPDLVILSSNSTNLSNAVKKWLSESRASILAVDPPPKGIHDVNVKYAILPILPLNGISSNNYGKLYLCNLSIPDRFYRDAGIKYKSPFGHKFVIPIHLKE